MSPSRFRACLVCDLVRPEAAGKLALLGFFGVCPNVHIQIAHLDQPTVLTFLFSGDPGEGPHNASVTLVDESHGSVIASAAPLSVTTLREVPTLVTVSLIVVFRHAGRFSARLLFEEEEQFRGEFHVSQGLI